MKTSASNPISVLLPKLIRMWLHYSRKINYFLEWIILEKKKSAADIYATYIQLRANEYTILVSYIGNRKFTYLFHTVGYVPNAILFTAQIDQPPAQHFQGLAGPLIAFF